MSSAASDPAASLFQFFRNLKLDVTLDPLLNPGDVDSLLATEKYSEDEIGSVRRSALSHALVRNLSDLSIPLTENSIIKITMDDFTKAITEVVSEYRATLKDLEQQRVYGWVDCTQAHTDIYKRLMQAVEDARAGDVKAFLLEGSRRSGMTTLAATIGLKCDFPYVKRISHQLMLGVMEESARCAKIDEVFEEAHKYQPSLLIVDEIDSLLEYCRISPLGEDGPAFSNLMLLTLLRCLNPPEGKKVMVIAITSELEFLNSIGLLESFSETHHVPVLRTEDVKKVLEWSNDFAADDIPSIAESLHNIPIKRLFDLTEMAKARRGEGEKISMLNVNDCLQIVRW